MGIFWTIICYMGWMYIEFIKDNPENKVFCIYKEKSYSAPFKVNIHARGERRISTSPGLAHFRPFSFAGSITSGI